jgi:hypothetical protein
MYSLLDFLDDESQQKDKTCRYKNMQTLHYVKLCMLTTRCYWQRKKNTWVVGFLVQKQTNVQKKI